MQPYNTGFTFKFITLCFLHMKYAAGHFFYVLVANVEVWKHSPF